MGVHFVHVQLVIIIKTHGHVLCGQVRVHKTQCAIYMNQLLAVFSHL